MTALFRGSHSYSTARPSARPLFTRLVAIIVLTTKTAACTNAEGASSAADSLAATGRAPNGGTPATITGLSPRDVAVATLKPIADGIVVTGSLDPALRVEVKAQLSGQLERVLADRGTAVSRGQPLAIYEASTHETRAASARAALAARERDLDAVDTLHRAGVLSERDYTQAQVAREAAEADLTQARQAVSYATVRSPIAGEISEKIVSSGEVVQPGAKLFTVVNNDMLELAAQVGAAQIARVRVGQAVRLTLDAYPGRVLTGRVARVEPVADAGTRRVGVYVRVANPGHEIVAGLFATGTILTSGDAPTPVVAVPAAAVRAKGSASTVYTVAGGRVVERTVSVGAHDETAGLIEIRAGLTAGEHVIVAPGTGITPGMSVRLTSDSSASSARTR